jgi:hypothetical protein
VGGKRRKTYESDKGNGDNGGIGVFACFAFPEGLMGLIYLTYSYLPTHSSWDVSYSKVLDASNSRN